MLTMRRRIAILLALWAATSCAADGTAAAPTPTPTAAESPAAAVEAPQVTPAPVGPPMRILWAPMQPQQLPVAVRVEPGVHAVAKAPALVAATAEQLKSAEGEFVSHFTSSLGFITTLQSLRDQKYNGGEEWMFSTTFAAGPFADQVRELVSIRRENEIRTFLPGEARLENAWVRPSNGVFGAAATIALAEGTISFNDEIVTGGSRTIEPHRWHVRALSQGLWFILDGAQAPAELAPMRPFDPATLDSELPAQISSHLHDEEAGPQAMPASPYKGTAYWDVRHGALDWLHELALRGSLTDRHFEDVRAQVTAFKPTSYLGDGYVTVQLRGTLVEVLHGVRRIYPVNESVMFQRFSFAQATWLAVDGQNDDGTWIAKGSYGTPEPLAHG
jgi:hypothetical protein